MEVGKYSFLIAKSIAGLILILAILAGVIGAIQYDAHWIWLSGVAFFILLCIQGKMILAVVFSLLFFAAFAAMYANAYNNMVLVIIGLILFFAAIAVGAFM